jgi:fatty-acyl-CoA synthase
MRPRLPIGIPGAGLAGEALERLGDGAHMARTFAGAGFVRPMRPDRPLRALGALARWGQTAAGGYAAAASMYPDEPAIVDDRGRLTFAEVHERTSRLAGALAAEGVGEGDGVAVMCRNHRGFCEAIVALSKLGADALLLNTAFAGPQLRDVLEREGPRAVIHDAEFAGLLGDALGERPGFVAWADADDEVDGPTLDDLIDSTGPGDPPKPGRTGRVTILTSGTTGTPKGASRGSPNATAAVSILSSIPLHARERVLCAAPLFHQWGYAHFMLGMLLASTLVLQRRFDPEGTLAGIDREQVTCCPMVPIMCRRIVDLPEEVRRRYDTSTLRTVPLSGSALPGDLAIRFMDEFGDVLYNLYGSTEVAWAAIAGPGDLREAPGTAGRPPRGTELRILGDDDEPVGPGVTGRIFVRNSMLFEGYTGGGGKDMVDGLMATGDVGHLDEQGRLFVEGRDDDMIVSGGENVFPQEVEETLLEHAAVREAAVVGVDDEDFGQRLRAFVVTDDGVDEATLKAHVKERLARYKVPREVVFLDELPRNATGKILKRELAEHGTGPE